MQPRLCNLLLADVPYEKGSREEQQGAGDATAELAELSMDAERIACA